MNTEAIRNYVNAQWDAQRHPGQWKSFIKWLLSGIEAETMEDKFNVDPSDESEVREMNEYIRSLDAK